MIARRFAFLFCTLSLFCNSGSESFAQTVIDGSDDQVTPEIVSGVKDAMFRQLADPASLQLAKLTQPKHDVLCGFYNAKNRMGGYVGFSQFGYRLGAEEAILIPSDFTLQELPLNSKNADLAIDFSLNISFLAQLGCTSEETSDEVHNQVMSWLKQSK